MNLPVERITIHHEGGGVPADGAWAGSAPYCALIGTTKVTYVQAPWTAWATMFYNHVSYDICLSGDRMSSPVTATDLMLIGQACDHARAEGWLDADAICYPHGTIYPPPAPYPTGSSPTQCPGTQTLAVWPALVAATKPLASIPSGGHDVPADKDTVDAYAGPDGAWKLQYDGGVETVHGGFYGSYFTLPAADRNDPLRRFLTICAPLDGQPNGYSIVSVAGEIYSFHTKQ